MSDRIHHVVLRDTISDAWAARIDIFWKFDAFNGRRARYRHVKKLMKDFGANDWNHRYDYVMDVTELYLKERDVASIVYLSLL